MQTAWLEAGRYTALSAGVCVKLGTSKMFDGRKSIKPDIMLTDLNGNILVDFEKIFLRGDIWQYLMKIS